jgi:alpha,alpha-trehalase
VKLYFERHRDRDLLARAYPVLKREFHDYWCAAHHQTPIGLATNRDLTDPALGNAQLEQFSLSATRLRPELAAEAEVHDFTAIYAGDVRQCVPLQTNCALVRHAQTLAWMAGEIGWHEESREWQAEAERRAGLIRLYCWHEAQGFFFEYQYEQRKQLPFWSLGAYWVMWAGVATAAQADRLVSHLVKFEHAHGLSQTDQSYPSPHAEFNALQFNYPNGWPPFQIVVIEALEAYGYAEIAQRLAHKFIQLQLDWFDRTGTLWEKYNVVAGNLDCPRERYPVVPLHGWSSAAVAYLGRKLFDSK